MAPINLPDGSEVSEVVLPDGSTASEVIAPDGSTVFSAIPDSGVARWTLDSDDTESGPTAVDVWNSNDGAGEDTVVTGVTGANQTYDTKEAWSLEPGRIQTSLTQSYFAGRSAISIGGWIKTSATEVALLSSTQRSDSNVTLTAEDGSGNATFTLRDVASISASAINDGTWHHLVGTYDGGTVAMYVDGSQVASTSASGSIVDQDTSTDLNAYLGSAKFTEDGSKNSDLDDPRVYDKGLTSTEVSNWYNNGSI